MRGMGLIRVASRTRLGYFHDEVG
jgi:hypothetical protein